MGDGTAKKDDKSLEKRLTETEKTVKDHEESINNLLKYVQKIMSAVEDEDDYEEECLEEPSIVYRTARIVPVSAKRKKTSNLDLKSPDKKRTRSAK